MSGSSIVQSMQPASQRLYDSSKCLASNLNSHQEAQCKYHCNNETSNHTAAGETPTLAALARHYRLSQLIRVIAPLVVLQERLYRRLERRPSIDELAKRSFPQLFQIMEDESKTIIQVARAFSANKESRFKMESNISLIRDSLNEILEAFDTVQQSKYDSPGRLDNKMAEMVDELRIDWTEVRTIRENLPERYSVNYGTSLEKTSL